MDVRQLESNEKAIIDLFLNAKKKELLSHAYLLVSAKDETPVDVAKYFMMMHYCEEENGPCGICNPCLQIEKNNFLNFYYIAPEGETIKKEQIQSLQAEFSKTSLQTGIRVYVIDDAHKMTQSAANSILKFLEEPFNGQTYAFLITDEEERMIPTILSRCQIIHFRNKAREAIENELKKQEINSLLAHKVSFLSNNMRQAKTLLEDRTFVQILEFTEKIMEKIAANDKGMLFFYKENQSIFFESQNAFSYFIDFLMLFYLDVYKAKHHLEELMFIDRAETIESLSNRLDIKKIKEMLDTLKDIRRRLNYNINSSFVMDELFIKLRKS